MDKGAVIPNITDGYSGNAPDLGALELGQALPHYAPAPDAVRPEWKSITAQSRESHVQEA